MTALFGSVAGFWRRGAVAGICFAWAAMAAAQTAPPASDSPSLLTSIGQIWGVTGASAQQPQRIKTQLVIYYFDPMWRCAWGECQGARVFLPFSDCPTPLKTGQRVAIDGMVIPAKEGFLWDKTKIQVLAEEARPSPVVVSNFNGLPADFNGTFISVQGLIDHIQRDDSKHIQLRIVAGTRRGTVRVLTDLADNLLPFKEGDYIRLKAVYFSKYNRDGELIEFFLWVGQLADVEVTGSLRTDPRFLTPATAIETIVSDTLGDQIIRVEGVVRSHEPGKMVTLWDKTGQVSVLSEQFLPVSFGQRVEAIGIPYALGVQRCLLNARYRVMEAAPGTSLDVASISRPEPLRLAAQILALNPHEIERHPLVNLWAVITWSHSDTPFVYVQDASGGIRLVNPKWEGTNLKSGAMVSIRGEVVQGPYAPVVTNSVISSFGWYGFDPARFVSLEQALTGVEDGHWVEMRGFVRKITPVGGLLNLDLSSSRGEFQAWAPAFQSLRTLLGSVVRIDGVCSVTANDRQQLTGIRLLVPEEMDFKIEESAPADPFAADFRALGDLKRFNPQNDLNQRVRTAGTVVLQQPGRFLDLQDGPDSVEALNQQDIHLQPGDRVEAVGFTGEVGGKFVLRDAIFRCLSSGHEPSPMPLPAVDGVNVNLDGLLAKAEGVLLNTLHKDDRVRMLIRSGGATFEAGLESANSAAAARLQSLLIGSRLALIGVYQVQNDEYGRPGSFLLMLRSGEDVRVLAEPSWWTPSRMLALLLGVIVVFVISLVWGGSISRKNLLLRQAQAELQTSNSQLEVRVLERTQEFREQVVVAERARTDLAQAQQTLVRASRNAGMAEVAIGVLHNVGNVLNSVNVSTSCLRDRTGRLPVELVGRTASLLSQPADQLARYLQDDPKGRLVPEFLAKLGEELVKEKLYLSQEIASLTKNVEHISAIVSMQQDYARVGGVLEELQIQDVVEDAIRVNAASFDRHGIQLVRHYQPVKPALLDRHKLMQILVNLLNNAKQALEARPSGGRIIISISAPSADCARVTVADNGVGISTENRDRIFSQGFTTRKAGHGFGLHNGALAARELGGSLSVHSDGPGHGAIFTLEFLCRPNNGVPDLARSPSINGKGKVRATV